MVAVDPTRLSPRRTSLRQGALLVAVHPATTTDLEDSTPIPSIETSLATQPLGSVVLETRAAGVVLVVVEAEEVLGPTRRGRSAMRSDH